MTISRRNGTPVERNAPRRKNEGTRLLGVMAKRHERPKAIMQEMSTDAHSASGTFAGSILAVDYGRARIGLAIAEPETGMPRPLLTLERINRNEDMRRLRELAPEPAVPHILVGLPLPPAATPAQMP